MSEDDRMLRAALAYAERFRFAVFPCRPRQKTPLTEHGFKDASKDPAQIRKWWERWPDANIGIATGAISGVVVLDIDPRHGGDDTLETLQAKHGKLLATPTVLTGGGGLHSYFRHPGGLVPNSASKIGQGIDLRGDGGYVIAPQSIHESGNRYLWEVSSRIDEIPFAELPAWILNLTTGAEAESAGDSTRFIPPPVFEDGTRNEYLYRTARSVHAKYGLNANEILNLLRGINLTRCKPPVDESELAEIANGAATQANRPDFKMPDPEVARLAAMSSLEYERIRKSEAKRLEVRVNVLDAEVEKLRPRGALEEENEPLAPPAPEPWHEPVEARAVLDELRAFVRRFVLVDAHDLVAIVLWVAFSHAFEIAETSPRLAITSPIKRCGKTRLIEILLMLCPRAVSSSNMSTNSVFRVIDAAHPTLFIDEADTLRANDKDELRGILNSGHTPANAYVIRNVPVGDTWCPKRFSTWAAVAMGGIGKLPDTWADRSITISMQRKPPREPVERLTRRNVAAREQAGALASKLARLAHDNLNTLREANPAVLESLNDRQADNWELLLAIADLAGADWSQRARDAAVALSDDGASETDSLGERLLRDIRETFSAQQADRLSSKALCEGLCSVEGAPWSEFGRTRKPLSPNRLARLLAPFAIASHTIRLEEGTAKGYLRDDFADAFDRYLTTSSVSGGNSVTSAAASRADAPIQSVTDKPGDVSENGTKPTSDGACDVVTTQNRQNGDGRRVSPVEEAEIDRLARADADGREPRQKRHRS